MFERQNLNFSIMQSHKFNIVYKVVHCYNMGTIIIDNFFTQLVTIWLLGQSMYDIFTLMIPSHSDLIFWRRKKFKPESFIESDY